jgi:hypothetical protein
MGSPSVSPSHARAWGVVCFCVWAVFLVLLGWDKRGGYGGWDGIGWGSMLGGCFFVLCVGVGACGYSNVVPAVAPTPILALSIHKLFDWL